MFEGKEYVEPEELDKLKDLMERVGESEERIEKLIKVAGADPDTFDDLMEVYSLKAAKVATKDEFYPYEELDGEISQMGGKELGEALHLVGKNFEKLDDRQKEQIEEALDKCQKKIRLVVEFGEDVNEIFD